MTGVQPNAMIRILVMAPAYVSPIIFLTVGLAAMGRSATEQKRVFPASVNLEGL